MDEIYKPSPDIVNNAHINKQQYETLYQESITTPNSFWLKVANKLKWIKNPTRAQNTSYTENSDIKWYEDGLLNACTNCVDRHLPDKANAPAIIYEGDEPGTGYTLTYQQLHDEICKFANALKDRGVKKGDRVTIYMPMIPETGIAMLACARIGAVHSVVFGGFSPDALKDRILDCKSNILITANEGLRAGKTIPLKQNADQALQHCPDLKTVIVFQRTQNNTEMTEGRDIWWHDITAKQPAQCDPEPMNAEDPLFILYTSGSTGKPKGVLHTTGGYMVYAHLTFETTFDYKSGEIFWCTADFGWVTGHSYIIYGPLSAGATTLVFESVPNYPDFSRFWQVVEKHKVNIFYTAPTAIRALLRAGDDYVTKTDRSSLRILGTVGEPINHEAWLWYYNIVGEKRCPIVDTWWQTETGGHLMTPLPGATDVKPGAACQPFFGIQPAIVDNEGNILDGECEGNFVILNAWPGQMRSLYNDHDRFIQTYFTTFPGMYCTGDGAKRDKDGYYWITGRVDDVINVAGHRLGTAEIENAINEHEAVAESAVTGFPHDIKGQGIYAYVTLKEGVEEHDELKAEITQTVRALISPIATPDIIQWASSLPKTRSGKIMRRILRKIAANEYETLGDTSTLADPTVVDDLIKGFKQQG